jgi:hypothetical protein
MKQLFLLVALLFLSVSAYSAPTWVKEASHRQTASATNAISFTGTAGDSVIVVVAASSALTSASIADTLGNTWTAPYSYDDNAPGQAVFYCQTLNSSSADTITITFGASGATYAAAEEYSNGSSGTSLGAFDKAATIKAGSATGATTNTTGSPAVSGELAVAFISTNTTSVVTAGSWTNSYTQRDASASNTPNYFFADNIVSAATSTGVTLSATIDWEFNLLLFKPASGGSSCTNTGWTQSGSIAAPVSGSTDVWLQSGAFGTVNCSSTSYYQPGNGGAFGDN